MAHAPTAFVHTCTDHKHTLYLRGMNAFEQGDFCKRSKIGLSGHFEKGNNHCLQLKGKPHPFTMVVLTQIIKALVIIIKASTGIQLTVDKDVQIETSRI